LRLLARRSFSGGHHHHVQHHEFTKYVQVLPRNVVDKLNECKAPFITANVKELTKAIAACEIGRNPEDALGYYNMLRFQMGSIIPAPSFNIFMHTQIEGGQWWKVIDAFEDQLESAQEYPAAKPDPASFELAITAAKEIDKGLSAHDHEVTAGLEERIGALQHHDVAHELEFREFSEDFSEAEKKRMQVVHEQRKKAFVETKSWVARYESLEKAMLKA